MSELKIHIECQECKRVEPPFEMNEHHVALLSALARHAKANFCCRVCGKVMYMEVK